MLLKRIKKPKGYEAPPMGDIISIDFMDSTHKSEYQNATKIYKYITLRLNEFQKDESIPISSMEVEDILELSKQLKKTFKKYEDGEKVITKIDNIIKFIINDFYVADSGYIFIDDIPKVEHIVGTGFEIVPSRINIRNYVNVIYESAIKTYKLMQEQIDKNDFKLTIGANIPLNEKAYITALIRKKIFLKEDIYGKVFEEKFFEDYKKLYTKYEKAYEKWLKLQ